MLETNDVLRSRPNFSAAPSNGFSAIPHAEDSQEDYKTYEEMGNGKEEDEDWDEDSYNSNPTRTTANSYSKHVPTVGVGRAHAMPPVFHGPELITGSSSRLNYSRTLSATLLISWAVISCRFLVC